MFSHPNPEAYASDASHIRVFVGERDAACLTLYSFYSVYSFYVLKRVINVGISTFLLTLLHFIELSIVCIFCSKAPNLIIPRVMGSVTHALPRLPRQIRPNQMHRDMNHGSFLGNPKADRSEA